MSENIFVPIDYSDAINSVPAGEQVIYSTMIMYEQNRFNNYATLASRYTTHMLMTENGIVFNGQRSKKKPPEYRYIPWTDIWRVGQAMGNGFIQTALGPGAESFYLQIDKNFEDKPAYKVRSKRFPLAVLPLMIRARKEFLQSPAAAALKPSKLKKIEKAIMKQEKQFDKLNQKLNK